MTLKEKIENMLQTANNMPDVTPTTIAIKEFAKGIFKDLLEYIDKMKCENCKHYEYCDIDVHHKSLNVEVKYCSKYKSKLCKGN